LLPFSSTVAAPSKTLAVELEVCPFTSTLTGVKSLFMRRVAVVLRLFPRSEYSMVVLRTMPSAAR